MKFLLISLLFALNLLQSQYTIPNIANVVIVIRNSKRVVEYHKEIRYFEYRQIKIIDEEGFDSEVYYPYDQDRILTFNIASRHCLVLSKSYNSMSYINKINECVLQMVKLKGNTVICDHGEVTYSERKIDGHFLPKSFTGFDLPDGQIGEIENIDYLYSESLASSFETIPVKVVCDGLMESPLRLNMQSYNVRKNDEEDIIIRVDTKDDYKSFSIQQNNTKRIFLIDQAEEWFIDRHGCKRNVISRTAPTAKYSQNELSKTLWNEYVMSDIKFFTSYKFYEEIADNVKIKKQRYESKVDNRLLFGKVYEHAHIVITTEEKDPNNYEISITCGRGKTDVYKVVKLKHFTTFDTDLLDEKRFCYDLKRRKRMTFRSGPLPKRDVYFPTDISTMTRVIARGLSSKDGVVSPMRILNILFSIRDEILNVELEMSEPFPIKERFLKLLLKNITMTLIKQATNVSLNTCFDLCGSDLNCEAVTFEHQKCILGNKIILADDVTSQGNSYLFMPYIRELSISEAKEVFSQNKSLEIDVDGNRINLINLKDAVISLEIDQEHRFTDFFEPNKNLACEYPIKLLDSMSYIQCAIEAQRLAKNGYIIGFSYIRNLTACMLCSRGSSIAVYQESKYKFNFINGYETIFERKIKDALKSSNLPTTKVSSIGECAEVCEFSRIGICVGFYYCSGECFISSDYYMDRFQVESTDEVSDMCTAERRSDYHLLSGSFVQIRSSFLDRTRKVQAIAATEIVIDSPVNIGYLRCWNDQEFAYIVEKTNLPNMYSFQGKPDTLCEFHQKIPQMNQKPILKRIVTEIDYKGYSKNGISWIVVSLFLLAFFGSIGATYYIHKKGYI